MRNVAMVSRLVLSVESLPAVLCHRARFYSFPLSPEIISVHCNSVQGFASFVGEINFILEFDLSDFSISQKI